MLQSSVSGERKSSYRTPIATRRTGNGLLYVISLYDRHDGDERFRWDYLFTLNAVECLILCYPDLLTTIYSALSKQRVPDCSGWHLSVPPDTSWGPPEGEEPVKKEWRSNLIKSLSTSGA